MQSRYAIVDRAQTAKGGKESGILNGDSFFAIHETSFSAALYNPSSDEVPTNESSRYSAERNNDRSWDLSE